MSTRTPFSLVIVDDSVLVRMGLRTLLSGETNILVVGEAGTVAEAVQLAQKLQPHLVLLDIRLPDGTGFDACRQILQSAPATRVLFLTSVVDDHLIELALQAGGHGYLLKEINGPGLVQAILDVAGGKTILAPEAASRIVESVKRKDIEPPKSLSVLLSQQENRVIALVAKGKTNKEIGNILQLSEKTVKNYLANVFSKLHINSRTQAAMWYTQNAKNE